MFVSCNPLVTKVALCVAGSTGRFWYKVNETSTGAFYFFLDDQWAQVIADEDCNSKLAKARFKGT